MSVDWLLKIWDKGGVALVMIVLLFLLARFIAKRGVVAFDMMAKAQTDSMTKIADAVQHSSAAQVVALGGLTERVSRMEGKVDTLGSLAVGEVRKQPHLQSRSLTIASAVEVFDDDGHTPIGGVHTPTEPQAVPVLRPSATAYHHTPRGTRKP